MGMGQIEALGDCRQVLVRVSIQRGNPFGVPIIGPQPNPCAVYLLAFSRQFPIGKEEQIKAWQQKETTLEGT